MFGAQAASSLRSLAEVHPDETIRIERILFGSLKDLCYGIGLEEGSTMHCRQNSRAIVLLETPGGRTVVLDADWARFIQVTPQEDEQLCVA